MKFKKIGTCIPDYASEDGRFFIKNHLYDENGHTIPRNQWGFDLYDNGELIGFFKTLKAARAAAESRI